MKARRRFGLVVSLTILVLVAADDPKVAKTPGLAESQVTVEIFKKMAAKKYQKKTFRATVLAKTDDTLTLLTAAHCMTDGGAAVSGGQTYVLSGEEVFESEIVSVARNPRYNPTPGHDLPGPDSAIVRLRLRVANPAAEGAFRAIQPAHRVAGRPYPWRSAVVARMIDRTGREHAIRGGNFSSPLFLEWAGGYKSIAGDSGAGVFVVEPDKEGRPDPTLVGVVTGVRTDGGGPASIASLVSLKEPWVVEALKPEPAR